MNIILTIIACIILFLTLINIIRMGTFLVGVSLYDIKNSRTRKKRTKPDSHKYLPRVSVIIPAHNEQGVIVRCMKSVCDNTYKNLEIIVVDDGSTDKTYKIIQQYKKQLKRRKIKLIRQKNSGKAVALNNAIKKNVTGELVMCLDADSLLRKDAVANAVEYFRDPTVKAMAANVKIIDDGRLMSLIQRYEYLISYNMKKSLTTFNIEYIIGGVGSVFRTTTLKQVKFYNTNTITEDINLTLKIVNRGNIANRIVYASNVIAYTEAVMHVRQLITQRFRWKYGRFQSFVVYRKLFFSTKKKYSKALTWVFLPYALFSEAMLFLEPIFIGFILYIIATSRNVSPIAFALIILSLYIGINVMSEEYETLPTKIKLIVLAPFMYFLFFLLSFIELVALAKSVVDHKKIFSSNTTRSGSSHWKHVERSGIRVSTKPS